jgi:hypothetical protein
MKFSITNKSTEHAYQIKFVLKEENSTFTVDSTNATYRSNDITHGMCLSPQSDGSLQPFDYAVLRYLWTPEDGQDLDTRTSITNPARNVEVGWSRQTNDETYLTWGGDNTGSGVESVLINVLGLIQSYPSATNITVATKAFWYSSRLTGNITVQFETYLGGTMSQSGFNFINTGGALVQSLSFLCNATSQGSSDQPGDLLGILTIDTASKTGGYIPV